MAKDILHNNVKIALQKDGWNITHNPYKLHYGIADVYIDLAAEEAIAAEKEPRKIVESIKTIINRAAVFAQRWFRAIAAEKESGKIAVEIKQEFIAPWME